MISCEFHPPYHLPPLPSLPPLLSLPPIQVPFEVLIRRQIARLLDPSLQCARFVYDELVKISHGCEGYEVQRFPVLRRRIEETVSVFLRDGLAPAETMIAHLINMEVNLPPPPPPSPSSPTCCLSDERDGFFWGLFLNNSFSLMKRIQ